METYRVIFDNNRPIYAMPMGKQEKNRIGEVTGNRRKQIKWLAVDGSDARDSISVAHEMVRLLKKFL